MNGWDWNALAATIWLEALHRRRCWAFGQDDDHDHRASRVASVLFYQLVPGVGRKVRDALGCRPPGATLH